MTTLRARRGTDFFFTIVINGEWVRADFDRIVFTVREEVTDSDVLDDEDALAQVSTDDDDGITFSGETGTGRILASETKLWPDGTIVWDCKGVDTDGVIWPLSDGQLRVSGDLTRSVPASV